MSLIGIDVGSSSVKVAAYSEDGELLEVTSHGLSPLHPEPGLWETDPEDIWQATSKGIQDLGAHVSLRKDPPKAIAVSASGRENFLADKNGTPLSNGIMGADTRGGEFEISPEGSPVPELWCLSCGHLRERMDPIFRLKWWRTYYPEIVEKAHYFFGWIDFLNFRMTGRAVMDQSTAARYMVYDLKTMGWDADRVAEYAVPANFLPEVLPWGSVISELKTEVAKEWGMPPNIMVAQGCHDLNCAAYGTGVYELGTVCLVSGSYENVLVPTDQLPTARMLLRGLSVMPHPCEVGLSVIAVHPTGNAVLNWVRDLVNIQISEMETALSGGSLDPSPVTAVPYLSGSMTYWEEGRKARGALVGLTLATSPKDVVKAFMESISYDLVNSLSLMEEEGIEVKCIRATGGGARSSWWTQLKADMTNMPIEVVEHPEPGTLGAALLAGLAVGVYDDMEEISRRYSGTSMTYEPDQERAGRHAKRLKAYRQLMQLILDHVY